MDKAEHQSLLHLVAMRLTVLLLSLLVCWLYVVKFEMASPAGGKAEVTCRYYSAQYELGPWRGSTC